MAERLPVLLKRLEKLEARQANAVRRGPVCLAQAWSTKANEAWSEILQLTEAHGNANELPEPMGPLARSAPFGQHKKDN